MSRRRIEAIFRKEFREYRRNRSVVAAMAIIPLVFVIQPVVAVATLPASASGTLGHEHLLLYMLGIPALVPTVSAAYAVVGERQQGTLEPVLTTPVRREEFLLGKALASLVPSVLVAYAVYAIFLACIGFFAKPDVTEALLRWPDIVAQVLFTPLIAAWSVGVCLAISARTKEVRVAQQLGVLASLPTVAATTLIAFGVLPHGEPILAAALLLLIGLGWRVMRALFDRERLIT